MASSPSPSISRVQASMLAFAEAWASCSRPHVVDERAAAASLPLRQQHHLDPVAPEEPDGGFVDGGAQHLLGAAGQHRHPDRAAAARRGRIVSPGRCFALGSGRVGDSFRLAARPRPDPGHPPPPAARRAGPSRAASSAARKPPAVRQNAGVEVAQPAVRRGAARRSAGCGRGRGRRDACSARPDGQVVMQLKQDRQRSTCLTTSAVAGLPPSSMSLMR